MDNGLLLGLIALIIFAVMLIISINNDIKGKREKDFINIVETSSNDEQTNMLLTELLITEKSSNAKLNVIMWIMLIPIIINIILLFLLLSNIMIIVETMKKFISLL